MPGPGQGPPIAQAISNQPGRGVYRCAVGMYFTSHNAALESDVASDTAAPIRVRLSGAPAHVLISDQRAVLSCLRFSCAPSRMSLRRSSVSDDDDEAAKYASERLSHASAESA